MSMPELTPPSRRPTSGGGDYPSDPDEMYKVLTWQNEQLVKLREQVNQLLSFRETTTNESINTSLRQNSSVCADSSTQTSLPSTPVKKQTSHPTDSPQLVVQQLVEDVSYVQINELAPTVEQEECTNSTQVRVVEEKVLRDMEEIQVVPLSACPVEPAVTCRDLAPPEDIDKMISDHEKKTRQPEPSMIGRLRDMGVSFIHPSDLNHAARQQDLSIWHPRATEPSLLSTTESTSDFSLMLNSAALKYLSDEQLAHVARTTTMGVDTESDSQVSFDAQKYLHRNEQQ